MSVLLSSQHFKFDNSTMANDIVQAKDGNYIIVGRIYNPNGDMGFAMKISPMGTILWEQNYSSVFSLFLSSVTKLPNDTYIATGSYFYSIYSGNEYVYVINFDDDGNLLWQRAYGEVDIQSDGYSVITTNDDGFIITGLSNENTPNTWVLKFDSNGSLEWNKKYDIGVAFSIIQTKDNGYALAGRSNEDEESLESSPFILKLDSQGNVTWQNKYEETSIYTLLNADIIETPCGHFVVVAKTAIMEVDSYGTLLWLDGDENLILKNIKQTKNGNYIVSGLYIVNYLEHAYLAILNKDALSYHLDYDKVMWDNVDIEYNSAFNSILLNNERYIVGCGYLPAGENNIQSFFCVFDPCSDVI